VLPLAFLPLLCPERLWVALPVLALHVLSGWPYQNQLDCQYTAPLIPLIFFSAVGGAVRLSRWLTDGVVGAREPSPEGAEDPRTPWTWRVIAVTVLATALTAHLFTARWRPGLPPPLSPYDGRHHLTVAAVPWRPVMWRRSPHVDLFHDIRGALPPRASLAVVDACAPHLTARPVLRDFRDIPLRPDTDLDFVLYSPRIPSLMAPGNVIDLLQRLVADEAWGVPWVHQTFLLFARPAKWNAEMAEALAALETEHPDERLGHLLLGHLALEVDRAELALREARALLALDPRDDWAKAVLDAADEVP
jgi:hypothetical protein